MALMEAGDWGDGRLTASDREGTPCCDTDVYVQTRATLEVHQYVAGFFA